MTIFVLDRIVVSKLLSWAKEKVGGSTVVSGREAATIASSWNKCRRIGHDSASCNFAIPNTTSLMAGYN
jgi:hypothetical protein